MREGDRLPKTTVGPDDPRTRRSEDNSEHRGPACPPGRFCLGKWAPPLPALTMSFVAAPGWASERLVENDGSSGVGTPQAGEVPEGLSAEAWGAISDAIVRDRYRAERHEDGEAVLLRDAEGRIRLRYGGLRAWDATGRELASRLEARGGRIALLLEDAVPTDSARNTGPHTEGGLTS